MNELQKLIQFNADHPNHSRFNYHMRALVCTLICIPIDLYFLHIDRMISPSSIGLFVLFTVLWFMLIKVGIYMTRQDANVAKSRSRKAVGFGIAMGLIFIGCCVTITFV